MENIKVTLIWGLLVFVIVFLVNYFVVFRGVLSKLLKKKDKGKSKKKKQKVKPVEEYIGFSYLIPKFNLDVAKMDLNFASIIISLANAFIISLVVMIINLIPWGLMFRMLLGFVLLFGVIYSVYELIGRYLVKKGWSK